MASLITHPTRIMKSKDVTVRIGLVPSVNRPSVSYLEGSERTEIVRIDNGRLAMYEFQGATSTNFAIDDTETKFRYVGDSGWADGVFTDSRVQMSVTANYLKNLQWAGDPESPAYYVEKGRFDEGQAIINRFRNNKELEAWIEIWKFIDTIDGGLSMYDVSCFAGKISEYKEISPGDGLVENSFNVMSSGEAYIGYHGALAPIRTGLPNRLVYPTLPVITNVGAPIRTTTVSALVSTVSTPIPLTDTLVGVDEDSTFIFSYRNGAGTALAELIANPELASKPMARVVKVSDNTFVPATVTATILTGLITVTPLADLEFSTQYYVEVMNGAMGQEVNPSTLVASATGEVRPLNGLRSGRFTTAAA